MRKRKRPDRFDRREIQRVPNATEEERLAVFEVVFHIVHGGEPRDSVMSRSSLATAIWKHGYVLGNPRQPALRSTPRAVLELYGRRAEQSRPIVAAYKEADHEGRLTPNLRDLVISLLEHGGGVQHLGRFLWQRQDGAGRHALILRTLDNAPDEAHAQRQLARCFLAGWTSSAVLDGDPIDGEHQVLTALCRGLATQTTRDIATERVLLDAQTAGLP